MQQEPVKYSTPAFVNGGDIIDEEVLSENREEMTFTITRENGRDISRNYVVIDGQIPHMMELFVQDMVDRLLDETKPTF